MELAFAATGQTKIRFILPSSSSSLTVYFLKYQGQPTTLDARWVWAGGEIINSTIDIPIKTIPDYRWLGVEPSSPLQILSWKYRLYEP